MQNDNSQISIFAFSFQLKGENERLRASLSADQWKMAEHNKQQMTSLTAKLREQTKVIQSQEKTVSLF